MDMLKFVVHLSLSDGSTRTLIVEANTYADAIKRVAPGLIKVNKVEIVLVDQYILGE